MARTVGNEADERMHPRSSRIPPARRAVFRASFVLAVIAVIALGLGFARDVRADAPESTPTGVSVPVPTPLDRARLARSRAALLAFGVREDDAALVQGDAAAVRCRPGTTRGDAAYRCEIADACYALAAARAELGQAHALAREFHVGAVVVPRARVFELAAGVAPRDLAELRRLESVFGPAGRATDEPNARTLLRLVRTTLATRVAAAATRSAVASRAAPAPSVASAAPVVDPALAEARALAARAASRAADDDDAYRARRGRSASNRVDARREAASALASSLDTRIGAIAGDERAPLLVALTAARAIVEVEPRLAALLDLEAELAARRHVTP